MKLFTTVCVALAFAPIALSQVNNKDCKGLILQSGSAQIEELQPQNGEKYRRPPMIAYEVQEDGRTRGLRLVQYSGIKRLDQELLVAASNWKYKARPECGSAKVPRAAGAIADESAALRVAEPELVRVYGPRVIGSEKPLNASLSGDMWVVSGTLHCGDGKARTITVCVGGVATAYLAKTDGRVIVIFHTK